MPSASTSLLRTGGPSAEGRCIHGADSGEITTNLEHWDTETAEHTRSLGETGLNIMRRLPIPIDDAAKVRKTVNGLDGAVTKRHRLIHGRIDSHALGL